MSNSIALCLEIPKLPPYQIEKQLPDDDDEEERTNFDDMENEDELENEMERAESRRRRQQQALLDEESVEEPASKSTRKKTYHEDVSAEKIENPYASDESSYLIPILVAIGAFIPLLFCLCKI